MLGFLVFVAVSVRAQIPIEPTPHFLQDPSGEAIQVSGYVLKTVYSLQDGKTIVKHELADVVKEQVGSVEEQKALDQRGRIRLFSRLNVVASRTHFASYFEELREIYDAHLNVFGGHGSSSVARALGESHNIIVNRHKFSTNIPILCVYVKNLKASVSSNLSSGDERIVVFLGSKGSFSKVVEEISNVGSKLRILSKSLQSPQVGPFNVTNVTGYLQEEDALSTLVTKFPTKVLEKGTAGSSLSSIARTVVQSRFFAEVERLRTRMTPSDTEFDIRKVILGDLIAGAASGNGTTYYTGHGIGGAYAVFGAEWSSEHVEHTYVFDAVYLGCDESRAAAFNAISNYVHESNPLASLGHTGRICRYGSALVDKAVAGAFTTELPHTSRIQSYQSGIQAYCVASSGDMLDDLLFGRRENLRKCLYFAGGFPEATEWLLHEDTVLSTNGIPDGGCDTVESSVLSTLEGSTLAASSSVQNACSTALSMAAIAQSQIESQSISITHQMPAHTVQSMSAHLPKLALSWSEPLLSHANFCTGVKQMTSGVSEVHNLHSGDQRSRTGDWFSVQLDPKLDRLYEICVQYGEQDYLLIGKENYVNVMDALSRPVNEVASSIHSGATNAIDSSNALLKRVLSKDYVLYNMVVKKSETRFKVGIFLDKPAPTEAEKVELFEKKRIANVVLLYNVVGDNRPLNGGGAGQSSGDDGFLQDYRFKNIVLDDAIENANTVERDIISGLSSLVLADTRACAELKAEKEVGLRLCVAGISRKVEPKTIQSDLYLTIEIYNAIVEEVIMSATGMSATRVSDTARQLQSAGDDSTSQTADISAAGHSEASNVDATEKSATPMLSSLEQQASHFFRDVTAEGAAARGVQILLFKIGQVDVEEVILDGWENLSAPEKREVHWKQIQALPVVMFDSLANVPLKSKTAAVGAVSLYQEGKFLVRETLSSAGALDKSWSVTEPTSRDQLSMDNFEDHICYHSKQNSEVQDFSKRIVADGISRCVVASENTAVRLTPLQIDTSPSFQQLDRDVKFQRLFAPHYEGQSSTIIRCQYLLQGWLDASLAADASANDLTTKDAVGMSDMLTKLGLNELLSASLLQEIQSTDLREWSGILMNYAITNRVLMSGICRHVDSVDTTISTKGRAFVRSLLQYTVIVGSLVKAVASTDHHDLLEGITAIFREKRREIIAIGEKKPAGLSAIDADVLSNFEAIVLWFAKVSSPRIDSVQCCALLNPSTAGGSLQRAFLSVERTLVTIKAERDYSAGVDINAASTLMSMLEMNRDMTRSDADFFQSSNMLSEVSNVAASSDAADASSEALTLAAVLLSAGQSSPPNLHIFVAKFAQYLHLHGQLFSVLREDNTPSTSSADSRISPEDFAFPVKVALSDVLSSWGRVNSASSDAWLMSQLAIVDESTVSELASSVQTSWSIESLVSDQASSALLKASAPSVFIRKDEGRQADGRRIVVYRVDAIMKQKGLLTFETPRVLRLRPGVDSVEIHQIYTPTGGYESGFKQFQYNSASPDVVGVYIGKKVDRLDTLDTIVESVIPDGIYDDFSFDENLVPNCISIYGSKLCFSFDHKIVDYKISEIVSEVRMRIAVNIQTPLPNEQRDENLVRSPIEETIVSTKLELYDMYHSPHPCLLRAASVSEDFETSYKGVATLGLNVFPLLSNDTQGQHVGTCTVYGETEYFATSGFVLKDANIEKFILRSVSLKPASRSALEEISHLYFRDILLQMRHDGARNFAPLGAAKLWRDVRLPDLEITNEWTSDRMRLRVLSSTKKYLTHDVSLAPGTKFCLEDVKGSTPLQAGGSTHFEGEICVKRTAFRKFDSIRNSIPNEWSLHGLSDGDEALDSSTHEFSFLAMILKDTKSSSSPATRVFPLLLTARRGRSTLTSEHAIVLGMLESFKSDNYRLKSEKQEFSNYLHAHRLVSSRRWSLVEPVALISNNGGTQSSQTSQNAILADITNGEFTSAGDFDQCYAINCAKKIEKNAKCVVGKRGHDLCHPNIFDPLPKTFPPGRIAGVLPTSPKNETRSLVEQLAAMSSAVYSRNGYVAEPGEWGLIDRVCITHHPLLLRVFQLPSHSVDCIAFFRKYDPSKTGALGGAGDSATAGSQGDSAGTGADSTATGEESEGGAYCSIVFEGCDGAPEITEVMSDFEISSLVEPFRGYSIFTGLVAEYFRLKKHSKSGPKIAEWMRMASDPSQCSHVNIVGHSMGAMLGLLHRMELGFGRFTGFSIVRAVLSYSIIPREHFGEVVYHLEDGITLFSGLFSLEFPGVNHYVLCDKGENEKHYTFGSSKSGMVVWDQGVVTKMHNAVRPCRIADLFENHYHRNMLSHLSNGLHNHDGHVGVHDGIHNVNGATQNMDGFHNVPFGVCYPKTTVDYVRDCIHHQCHHVDLMSSALESPTSIFGRTQHIQTGVVTQSQKVKRVEKACATIETSVLKKVAEMSAKQSAFSASLEASKLEVTVRKAYVWQQYVNGKKQAVSDAAGGKKDLAATVSGGIQMVDGATETAGDTVRAVDSEFKTQASQLQIEAAEALLLREFKALQTNGETTEFTTSFASLESGFRSQEGEDLLALGGDSPASGKDSADFIKDDNNLCESDAILAQNEDISPQELEYRICQPLQKWSSFVTMSAKNSVPSVATFSVNFYVMSMDLDVLADSIYSKAPGVTQEVSILLPKSGRPTIERQMQTSSTAPIMDVSIRPVMRMIVRVILREVVDAENGEQYQSEDKIANRYVLDIQIHPAGMPQLMMVYRLHIDSILCKKIDFGLEMCLAWVSSKSSAEDSETAGAEGDIYHNVNVVVRSSGGLTYSFHVATVRHNLQTRAIGLKLNHPTTVETHVDLEEYTAASAGYYSEDGKALKKVEAADPMTIATILENSQPDRSGFVRCGVMKVDSKKVESGSLNDSNIGGVASTNAAQTDSSVDSSSIDSSVDSATNSLGQQPRVEIFKTHSDPSFGEPYDVCIPLSSSGLSSLRIDFPPRPRGSSLSVLDQSTFTLVSLKLFDDGIFPVAIQVLVRVRMKLIIDDPAHLRVLTQLSVIDPATAEQRILLSRVIPIDSDMDVCGAESVILQYNELFSQSKIFKSLETIDIGEICLFYRTTALRRNSIEEADESDGIFRDVPGGASTAGDVPIDARELTTDAGTAARFFIEVTLPVVTSHKLRIPLFELTSQRGTQHGSAATSGAMRRIQANDEANPAVNYELRAIPPEMDKVIVADDVVRENLTIGKQILTQLKTAKVLTGFAIAGILALALLVQRMVSKVYGSATEIALQEKEYGGNGFGQLRIGQPRDSQYAKPISVWEKFGASRKRKAHESQLAHSLKNLKPNVFEDDDSSCGGKSSGYREMKTCATSAVYLARKENWAINDGSQNEKSNTLLARCARFMPAVPSKWHAWLMLDNLPAHVLRVFYRPHLLKMPLFYDEVNELVEERNRSLLLLLAWRRSILYLFVLIATWTMFFVPFQQGTIVSFEILGSRASPKTVTKKEVEKAMSIVGSSKKVSSDYYSHDVARRRSLFSSLESASPRSLFTSSSYALFDSDLFMIDSESAERYDYHFLHPHSTSLAERVSLAQSDLRSLLDSSAEAIKNNYDDTLATTQHTRKYLSQTASTTNSRAQQKADQVKDSIGLLARTSATSVPARGFEDQIQDSQDRVSDTADSVRMNTLESSIVIYRRLKRIVAVTVIVRLVITMTLLVLAVLALKHWKNHTKSTKLTLASLMFRVLLTVFFSVTPWYDIVFAGDDAERPEELNNAARQMITAIVNLPGLSFSLMMIPGILSGSKILMQLLPFSIIPYIFFVICLLFTVMSLWPLANFIGGLTNWKIWWGTALYIIQASIPGVIAILALFDFTPFIKHGSKTGKKSLDQMKKGASKRQSFYEKAEFISNGISNSIRNVTTSIGNVIPKRISESSKENRNSESSKAKDNYLKSDHDNAVEESFSTRLARSQSWRILRRSRSSGIKDLKRRNSIFDFFTQRSEQKANEKALRDFKRDFEANSQSELKKSDAHSEGDLLSEPESSIGRSHGTFKKDPSFVGLDAERIFAEQIEAHLEDYPEENKLRYYSQDRSRDRKERNDAAPPEGATKASRQVTVKNSQKHTPKTPTLSGKFSGDVHVSGTRRKGRKSRSAPACVLDREVNFFEKVTQANAGKNLPKMKSVGSALSAATTTGKSAAVAPMVGETNGLNENQNGSGSNQNASPVVSGLNLTNTRPNVPPTPGSPNTLQVPVPFVRARAGSMDISEWFANRYLSELAHESGDLSGDITGSGDSTGNESHDQLSDVVTREKLRLSGKSWVSESVISPIISPFKSRDTSSKKSTFRNHGDSKNQSSDKSPFNPPARRILGSGFRTPRRIISSSRDLAGTCGRELAGTFTRLATGRLPIKERASTKSYTFGGLGSFDSQKGLPTLLVNGEKVQSPAFKKDSEGHSKADSNLSNDYEGNFELNSKADSALPLDDEYGIIDKGISKRFLPIIHQELDSGVVNASLAVPSGHASGHVSPRGSRTPLGTMTPRGNTTPRGNVNPLGSRASAGNATPGGNVTPRGNVSPRRPIVRIDNGNGDITPAPVPTIKLSSRSASRRTGVSGSPAPSPRVFRRVTRRSQVLDMPIADLQVESAVLQATLMSHLQASRQPMVLNALAAAKVVQIASITFLWLGLCEMMEYWIEDVMMMSISSYSFSLFWEGLVNKILIQCCFVDWILFLMIQLRLFNGYMQDDWVLTLFCETSGIIEKINAYVMEGIRRSTSM